VGWARTYLARAGLVRPTRRAYFEITDRGRQVLAGNPARIDNRFLSQFREFQEFRRTTREAEGDAEAVTPEPNPTPDEQLRDAHRQIQSTLATELLDRLLEASPTFFENAIVNLLVGMGYGGSRKDAGRAIGRSGDNGLDGVIDQDALGLDRVYIQAKRYRRDNGVGEGEVRGFAGSLDGVHATKGVFVTTSYFTQQAREFANRIARRIVLIDGQQLADLMIKQIPRRRPRRGNIAHQENRRRLLRTRLTYHRPQLFSE
jgi:restriction system protein